MYLQNIQYPYDITYSDYWAFVRWDADVELLRKDLVHNKHKHSSNLFSKVRIRAGTEKGSL